MKILEIEKFAKEQINSYIPDWKFEWNNRKRALGVCSYRKKTISLSKPIFSLIENATPNEVKNVIFHEIAHVLAPGDGHGKLWKRKCIELGGNGQRLGDIECSVPGKYIYVCPNCGKETHKYRKIRVKHACGNCCKKYNGGKYTDEYRLVLKVLK